MDGNHRRFRSGRYSVGLLIGAGLFLAVAAFFLGRLSLESAMEPSQRDWPSDRIARSTPRGQQVTEASLGQASGRTEAVASPDDSESVDALAEPEERPWIPAEQIVTEYWGLSMNDLKVTLAKFLDENPGVLKQRFYKDCEWELVSEKAFDSLRQHYFVGQTGDALLAKALMLQSGFESVVLHDYIERAEYRGLIIDRGASWEHARTTAQIVADKYIALQGLRLLVVEDKIVRGDFDRAPIFVVPELCPRARHDPSRELYTTVSGGYCGWLLLMNIFRGDSPALDAAIPDYEEAVEDWRAAMKTYFGL